MNRIYLTPTDTHQIITESTRTGFGRGLKRAGDEDESVVALCADLTESIQMQQFAEAHPERFVQVGVAEQNLVTLAAGMSAMGKKPFAGSYAAFSPGRNWEQIRTTICLNKRFVCIVGSHVGLHTGPDGATHQMLEDIALMRVLPGMIVIAPGDAREAEKATRAIAQQDNPAYLRLAREATPVFSAEDAPFEIGKAYVLREGTAVTLLSTGVMTPSVLRCAERLAKKGIAAEMIHVPTIKPLDEVAIMASLRKTGRAVVVEEGQVAGGFGGAICELASAKCPVPIHRIGVNDVFGQSGKPEELLEHYGLSEERIMEQIEEFLLHQKKENS